MIRRITILALAVFALAPALAQQITIDYDRDAELGAYKTFAYKPGPNTADDLMDGRLVAGLEKMMTDAGLQKVDSDPDVYVTYHVQTKERRSYTTSGFGYNYGPGWGRFYDYGPYYGSYGFTGGTDTVTEQVWQEGELIIDVWDPETDRAVWRGTSMQTLKQKPEKVAKQIDRAYAKMLGTWEKMVRKM